MKENIKDIAIRTVKTFIATFLAALALSVNSINDETTAKAAVIAAASAAITAAINIVIKAFQGE